MKKANTRSPWIKRAVIGTMAAMVIGGIGVAANAAPGDGLLPGLGPKVNPQVNPKVNPQVNPKVNPKVNPQLPGINLGG
jgi:hypothetical protein